MTREAGRFYTARFVMEWTGQETRELAELLDGAPDDYRLRTVAVPLALGVVANYRMALEHVAHEVARIACPHATAERVSFPVAHDGYAFRSMMLTRFPGLRVNHPRAWRVLRDVQPYQPAAGEWLAHLHGLWNHTLTLRVEPPGRSSDGGIPAPEAASAAVAAPSLVYGAGWSVQRLLARVAAEEGRLVRDLDEALREVEDPVEVLERRYRR